jgi:hypothetical protein
MNKIILQKLQDQIDYEEQMITEYRTDRATIPHGWSIEKQEAFAKGMAHALNIIKLSDQY